MSDVLPRRRGSRDLVNVIFMIIYNSHLFHFYNDMLLLK